jgi:1-deoxy-D-xylulose-5-phosphate reductoisomerase
VTTRPDQRRRLILLGSTGSIGVNCLEVIGHLGDGFEVVGLAAGGANPRRLAEQARRFAVRHIAIADTRAADELAGSIRDATIYRGDDAASRLVEQVDADMLIGAVVGAAGLPATLAAIERRMDVALANKETLVAAGELVVPLARRHNVQLLPIDSEHSAVFQCLQGCEETTKRPSDEEQPQNAHDRAPRGSVASSPGRYPTVKRIVLTASGGPFRDAPKAKIDSATVEQALDHPTWNMGPKITIDSATMMNKALEIIEAHWLFGLRADQIEVIIHPQSIVHSFVEFSDHTILAQMGPPDMRTPIQYALTWPARAPGGGEALDWSALSRLDFHRPDPERFGALDLAYRVIEAGGTSGAVLNAANEAAVAAFLEHRIAFGRITDLAAAALDAIPARPADSLDAVLDADHRARRFVAERIGQPATMPGPRHGA